MRKKITKIIILFVFLVSICFTYFYFFHVSFNYNLFKQKRNEWQSYNLNNYYYYINFDAGGHMSLNSRGIVVQDKSVKYSTSVFRNYTNQKYEYTGDSIDTIFSEIEEEYINWKAGKKTEFFCHPKCRLKKINIEYDEKYSYPSKYQVSCRCPVSLTDGGRYYRGEITEFKPTNGEVDYIPCKGIYCPCIPGPGVVCPED